MGAKEISIAGAQAAILKLIPVQKTLRDKLFETALLQVGVIEKPSNNVLYNTWFYGREVFDGDKPGAKYPWCCTEMCWLFNEIGKPMPKADYLRGWSSVPNLYAYAVKHDMITTTPKKGDLVIYAWAGAIKHIGMFGEWEKENVDFHNVEGNTAFDEKGDQANGGCCAYKHRKMNIVKCFINVDKFLA